MSKRKLLTVILLLTALLAMQFGSALAAPATQETTPVVGTVQSITVETDPTTLETTVVVTLDDGMGGTQTVRLGAADAELLGLVTFDEATGMYVPVDTAIGTSVSIDAAFILPEDGLVEDQHPVGGALSDFFGAVLGVDYDTIMTTHEDGVGFGVIAQALWLTNALEGDSTVFAAIIEAKKTGNYELVTLPDGTHPTNWGQFRKALLDKKQNLGQIMSGHATPLGADGTMQTQGNNGKGHNKDHKGNNGKGPKK